METDRAKKTAKKRPKAAKRAAKRHETVTGFSRFLYAMNLMLEAASSQSAHDLTRHEILLLSIFRNGIISRRRVEEEFRKLLAVDPMNTPAAQALTDSFDGLVRKGLIEPVKRSVKITPEGRSELKRLSEIVDTVYDRLVDTLRGRDRDALLELMRKIGSAATH